MAHLIAPRPNETSRDHRNSVSLLACGKPDRDHRDHSLRERAIWSRPLRAHSPHRCALVETPLRCRCAQVFRRRCADHVDCITQDHPQPTQPSTSVRSFTSNAPRHPANAQRVPQAILRGKGGIDLVALACMLTFNADARPIRLGRAASFAASPVVSFAVLDRGKTAGSGWTRQRAPQGLAATVCADTLQTRSAGQAPKAGFAGPSSHRPHDRKSRGRGFRARTASAPFTLVDTGRSHEARPGRPLAKRLNPPKLPAFPANRPGYGMPGGKSPSRGDIRGARPISRGFFPQLFVADCSNTGRHR